MDQSTNLSETYRLIGEFVNKANSIEFLVNTSLQHVMLALGEDKETQLVEINYTYDAITELSIRSRLSSLIFLLIISNENSEEFDQKINTLTLLYKDYNKKIRPYRDFMAHNPYMDGSNKIVNSRRYKGEKNTIESIAISELPNLISDIYAYVIKLFDVNEYIHRIFPGEFVVRDLDSKP